MRGEAGLAAESGHSAGDWGLRGLRCGPHLSRPQRSPHAPPTGAAGKAMVKAPGGPGYSFSTEQKSDKEEDSVIMW